STPALSLDGRFMFGGSDQNRSFWKIDLADGAEIARVPLTQYCWAGAPLVLPDDHILIAEGMSFAAPNPETEGKLYAMRPDAVGSEGTLASIALRAGHLNGGAATLSFRESGTSRRVYATANGYGTASAALIALDFDPQTPTEDPPRPTIREAWRVVIGGSALSYATCVTTRDGAVFVNGPADHVLYAFRDADAAGRNLWSLALSQISRVAGWQVANQRGPQAPIIGPIGELYWNAPDGYLYQIEGWHTGDVNGDEAVDASDVTLLETLVADRAAFELQFPEVPIDAVADVDGNNVIDGLDVAALQALITP
ncbi:MAG: dockerin type I repeat-containing protein, partial [Phycisphaerales bacterium]|nr:dockerin type I repeat-containing protein [Phycisphaerales bacterium]